MPSHTGARTGARTGRQSAGPLPAVQRRPKVAPFHLALLMVFLLLGALTLLVIMSALGMFSRAQVRTIKAFGVWVVALGGLLMAALLLLAGRGFGGLAILGLLGPLLWSFRAPKVLRPGARQGARQGARPGARQGARAPGSSGMTPEEARSVLGLKPGADRAAIQAAYVRLMQAAHPDRGGSDWLAARINQARDVLMG